MPALSPVRFMKCTESNISEGYFLRILRSLRRIIRVGDIHSRKLLSEFRITSPQMICLNALAKREGMTQADLAKEVDLSASTITGIIDRLEAKGYVVRTRGTADRRKVTLRITERGREVVYSAPGEMQDRLFASLLDLPEPDQAAIAASLERVLELMLAEHPELLDGTAADGVPAPTQTETPIHQETE